MNGLFGVLSNFPSEEHIVKVCKRGQGEETCRYLAVTDRHICAKLLSLRETLDEKVKNNQMRAKGDNCGGGVDILIKNQKELVGKKIEYEEAVPTVNLSGSFVRFSHGEVLGAETLGIVWKEKGSNKEEQISNFNLQFLQITVSPSGITFSARGAGIYGGITTIHLD